MKIKLKHWITLIILSLIWGSSFILIKRGLEYFTPIQVGALRITFAGLFLLPISIKHIKLMPRKNFTWLVMTAVVGSFIPMFLFPIAEVHLHSSIAGIHNALMSIFVIILGALFFKYKTHLGEITGVAFSFIGVVMLLQGPGSSTAIANEWFYHLLLIIAALMYAYSGVLTQKYMGSIPPLVWTAFIEFILLVPALIVLISTGFFQTIFEHPEALKGLGFVFLLALFGSALANIYYYKLIAETNASFASSVSLLMPLIAFGWGLLDGEQLGWIQICGGLLIVAGLYFGRKEITIKRKVLR
ncbi:DMT family transporter [Myroides pelagicus]|uniref:EamA family transporter n=1 Tax=Myroides pelagicus TaxID=270914 RepID=A0A7K1GML3_9FLAO|nr:DMT family transporter [Myroides pelagicus]MEC4113172.1 DMT family transporter [Myroides pelagicus]MTH29779.1 EamA family transporter [Myroides pelagicus]